MLTIRFDTDNAAYRLRDVDEDDEDTPDAAAPLDGEAVADSVRHVASLLDDGFTSGPITDPNGNTVGSWSLTDSD